MYQQFMMEDGVATAAATAAAESAEENGSNIDDILKSGTHTPSSLTRKAATSPPTTAVIESALNPEVDLPGSLESTPPPAVAAAMNNDEKRPSSTLQIDTEEGVATMSDSSAPPTRLPPLRAGSQDGDGLEGYRQHLDLGSTLDEVSIFEKYM